MSAFVAQASARSLPDGEVSLSLGAPGWKFGEIQVRGPALMKDNALAA